MSGPSLAHHIDSAVGDDPQAAALHGEDGPHAVVAEAFARGKMDKPAPSNRWRPSSVPAHICPSASAKALTWAPFGPWAGP